MQVKVLLFKKELTLLINGRAGYKITDIGRFGIC